MVCKTSGANVIVVDPIASRRETALKYGADHVVDPSDGKVEDSVNIDRRTRSFCFN